jgi:D-alanyl-D-alanine carboxypeptidase
MFRSLITLLLFAGINSAVIPQVMAPVAFDFPPVLAATHNFDSTKLLTVSSIPRDQKVAVKPVVEAEAALLMDLDSGLVLYEKNPYKRLPIASLTKIMTAILILESHDLNEVVTVEDNFNLLGEEDLGVRIWLQQYEKITVGDLLIALLVRSAGDSALALAKHHSGSTEAFVDEMNRKVAILNLGDTSFENPIGLDHVDHFSTVFDLAILTKYALRDTDFRRIVRMDEATITSTNGKIKHEFDSTNYLLNSYLNIYGVKTGTTQAAGQSLINLARNKNGKEVIVILLNSPERFQESKRIIDWSFRNFLW